MGLPVYSLLGVMVAAWVLFPPSKGFLLGGMPQTWCVLPTPTTKPRQRLNSLVQQCATTSRTGAISSTSESSASIDGVGEDTSIDTEVRRLLGENNSGSSGDDGSSGSSSLRAAMLLDRMRGEGEDDRGSQCALPSQERTISFASQQPSSHSQPETKKQVKVSPVSSGSLPIGWIRVGRDRLEDIFPSLGIERLESDGVTSEDGHRISIAQSIRRMRLRRLSSCSSVAEHEATKQNEGTDGGGGAGPKGAPAAPRRRRVRRQASRRHADERPMSWKEEMRETKILQVAAFAAAKRGTGERERLIECEAPVEEFTLRGRRVLVKRDDKMRLSSSGLSGNKARKLYTLNKTPDDRFPSVVVSHGGYQSNAMVAIAAVVAAREGSTFVYYTKSVPRWLTRNPVGNFARAKALGAQIVPVHPQDYERMFGGFDGPESPPAEGIPDGALFLPQGGADAAAEEGVSMLADEIIDYWDATSQPGQTLKVVLPAGTGTTALFLARYLVPEGIAVHAVPCVGEGDYLLRQMAKVDRESGNKKIFPSIMEGNKKSAFGVPRLGILQTWRELESAGLFVDLLYAAPTWEIIFDQWNEEGARQQGSHAPEEPQLLYVHCGGLEGVSTQLVRYKHKGLVEGGKLQ